MNHLPSVYVGQCLQHLAHHRDPAAGIQFVNIAKAVDG